MKTNVDNPKIERILEKLRKLMDLEASARSLGNEGEANAAAAGINRLLIEYNLELEDVPVEQKIKDPVERELVVNGNTPYMGYPWYRFLFDVVCKYNLCKALRSRADRTCLYVVGRKTNRETVLYLFSFLTSCFVRLGRLNYKRFKYKCLRNGVHCPDACQYMKSYLLGCALGLEQKFKDEQETMLCDVATLVVSNDKLLQDYLSSQDIGPARRQRAQDYLQTALQDGQTDGYNVQINKGLEGKSKTIGLL